MYSFAIVLWQIITQTQPLEHHEDTDMDEFTEAIAKKGERPTVHPIRDTPEFVKLLTDCWDGDPKKRPEFVEILRRLQEIRAEIFLRPYCKFAYEIWCKNWLASDTIYFNSVTHFLTILTPLDAVDAILDPKDLAPKDPNERDEVKERLSNLFPSKTEVPRTY